MKKWGLSLLILLFATGLCWAQEPAVKAEKAQDSQGATEKAVEQKAPEQGPQGAKAAEQGVLEQKAPEQGAPEQAVEQKAPEQGPDGAKAAEQTAPEAPAKADMDKVSYVIGLMIGRDLKGQGIEDLKSEPFMKGFNDSTSGATPAMTDEEIQKVMTLFSAEMTLKKEEQTKKILDENKAKEEAFLDDNKKKEGVQTLPSGLQYKVLKGGSGKKPGADDTVTVNYRGTLIDGKEFDSSYKRNQPATFAVSGVIPGWTEALELMQPGAKWMIYIPSKLAYQEMGVGEVIPPNSTLVFEVELVSVKAAVKKAAAKTGTQTKAKAKAAAKSSN